MDKQEFYAQISKVVNRPLNKLEINLLDIACEPDADDKRRLEIEVEEGMRSTLKGRIPEFIALNDIPARAAEGNYGYWLYDRNTKTWLIGLSKGTHEHLAGTLYGIMVEGKVSAWGIETAAEKYIEEHLGFFVSGAMNMYIPIKDDGCILTAEEQVFNQVKGNLGWRGI